MIRNDKKLVVFKDDINATLSDKVYVKLLDDESAIFYNPIIAPKYFKNYLNENNIKEAYIISDKGLLNKYKDYIYTFKENMGVYKISKGIKEENKKILFIDKGMDIDLGLPTYLYEFVNGYIELTRIDSVSTYKEYCYVDDEDNIDKSISKFMMDAKEEIPGKLILNKKATS